MYGTFLQVWSQNKGCARFGLLLFLCGQAVPYLFFYRLRSYYFREGAQKKIFLRPMFFEAVTKVNFSLFGEIKKLQRQTEKISHQKILRRLRVPEKNLFAQQNSLKTLSLIRKGNLFCSLTNSIIFTAMSLSSEMIVFSIFLTKIFLFVSKSQRKIAFLSKK